MIDDKAKERVKLAREADRRLSADMFTRIEVEKELEEAFKEIHLVDRIILGRVKIGTIRAALVAVLPSRKEWEAYQAAKKADQQLYWATCIHCGGKSQKNVSPPICESCDFDG